MLLINENKINLYSEIISGIFVRRVNRFTAEVDIGKTVIVHVPTTGRMQELLYPGAEIYVTPVKNKNRKTGFELVGAKRNGKLRVIDSRAGNAIFPQIINQLPDFEGWEIEKTENVFGGSRFDFLIKSQSGKGLVEVKTCTILENGVAAFPDAPSERAVKHINHLVESMEEGYVPFLVILISGTANTFIPNFHTDRDFTRAFIAAAGKINILAVYYEVDSNFNIIEIGKAGIPFCKLEKMPLNSGSYIISYYLPEKVDLTIGNSGTKEFGKGYYLYVGSAKNVLTTRTSRHAGKVKNKHWHVDYIHPPMKYLKTYTFVSLDIECLLAEKLEKIFQVIHGFGASDCKCSGHLFFSDKNPEENKDFVDTVFGLRFHSDLLFQ